MKDNRNNNSTSCNNASNIAASILAHSHVDGVDETRCGSDQLPDPPSTVSTNEVTDTAYCVTKTTPHEHTPAAFLAFIWRLHFYAGIFIGPFIFVAATSGTCYAVMSIITPKINAHLLHVTADGKPLSLCDQVARAQADKPLWHLRKIQINAGNSHTTWVIMADAHRSEHVVFVDPYRGTILGDKSFSGDTLATNYWLDTFHRTLWLGNIGRMYSELAASWLWIITISGISLWVYRLLHHNRDTVSQHRSSRKIHAKIDVRTQRVKTVHSTTGIVCCLGMLFLSATGITWSHYAGDHVDAIRIPLHWTRPPVHIPAQELISGTPSKDYDQLLASIEHTGMKPPFLITLSQHGGMPIVVTELAKDFRSTRGNLGIDPVSLEVKQKNDFRTFPIMAQIADWAVRIHMGNLFGWWNRLLLVFMGLGIMAIVILGYIMLWSRKNKFIPIPPRHIIHGLGKPTKILLGVTAIILGVFLPVLGASLLLFCLFDAVRYWATNA